MMGGWMDGGCCCCFFVVESRRLAVCKIEKRRGKKRDWGKKNQTSVWFHQSHRKETQSKRKQTRAPRAHTQCACAQSSL